MGVVDTGGKQYLPNPVFFADAFNYLLYGEKQIIRPDELKELDTSELTVPYGNNARMPVQKYRNLLKMWNAMMDEKAIHVILETELQDKVHYGMPVKDGMYEMLNIPNEEMKRFVPNYWTNLISPADMDDTESKKFRTHLGLAMKVIKHQSVDADQHQ